MRSKAEATERPDRQRTVIAQQHVVLLAEILLQAGTLVMIERDAFIVVIGEIVGDKLRGLVQRQQAFQATRHGGAVRRCADEAHSRHPRAPHELLNGS